MAATAFGDLAAAQVLDADTINQLGGAWATSSPTYTNVTIGNATVTSKWKQIGRTVIWNLDITLGNTSSVSGQVGVSLPVTAARGGCMAATIIDGGVGTYDAAVLFNTTRADLYVMTASGTYTTHTATSASVPINPWAAADRFFFTIVYEAAANGVS